MWEAIAEKCHILKLGITLEKCLLSKQILTIFLKLKLDTEYKDFVFVFI